eukprot:g69874.t1
MLLCWFRGYVVVLVPRLCCCVGSEALLLCGFRGYVDVGSEAMLLRWFRGHCTQSMQLSAPLFTSSAALTLAPAARSACKMSVRPSDAVWIRAVELY